MKNKSKKIGKVSELMWVLGILLVAIGVALCKKADLGVSMIAAPTFIIQEAIYPLWNGFTAGTVEYMVQGVILIILCLAIRKFNWRYLLAFAVAVIYGYALDLWMIVFGKEPFTEVYLRWIMLLIGDVCVAAGVACFFRTYMPLEVPELFVAEFAKRYNFKVNKTKLVYDLTCLAVSSVLALTLFGDAKTFDWSKIAEQSYHSIGLGTVVTTFINAPIITFFGKILDKIFVYTPLFPKLEKALSCDKKNNVKKETPAMDETSPADSASPSGSDDSSK